MIKLLISIVAFWLGASVAMADMAMQPAVSLQTGAYRNRDENGSNASLAVEYRSGESFTPWTLSPIGGVMFTTVEDWFLFVGLMRHFELNQSWQWALSFSPMYYSYSGFGRDLGLALEFRSKIEASYALPNRARLGIGLSHISNANLSHHFGNGKNPGVEILSLSYTVPIVMNARSR